MLSFRRSTDTKKEREGIYFTFDIIDFDSVYRNESNPYAIPNIQNSMWVTENCIWNFVCDNT